MNTITSVNKDYFKSYLRSYSDSFAQNKIESNLSFVNDLLIIKSVGISSTSFEKVNIIVFNNGDNVSISTDVNNNEYIYFPAFEDDLLTVGIDSTSYQFKFGEDYLIVDENFYELDDEIIVGNKILTIKGFGGVLLESMDGPEPPVYSVGISTSVLDEGQSISFNITAENVSSGTELYYTLSGTATSNDFTDNTLSGSFSVINFGNGIPTGTVTKTITLDLITEGTETFVFQVRTGSTSGPIVATSSIVTINDTNPTFTITPSSISINESQSVTFNIQTTKIPNGTELYFTTIGNVTSNDFTNNSLSGAFAIIGIGGDNGVGAFTRTTTFDVLSTQNKNFQVQIRINSITGTIVGISSTVTINNVNATFSITPSTTTINEGDTVTFNISSNVPNGTVIYYTTAGDVSASDFTDNLLSGSVTINNQTATITKIATRDRKTEGNQSFALQLRFGSVTGSVLATSSFVTIKDTSRNVGENANGLTFGPVQVNRDNGNQQLVSDWYSICDIDSLPEGSKIALFIDTSGSMTQATIQASYDLLVSKLSEKNISIITVTNPNEDWITPFLTELD
jgi:hypothetical protein